MIGLRLLVLALFGGFVVTDLYRHQWVMLALSGTLMVITAWQLNNDLKGTRYGTLG